MSTSIYTPGTIFGAERDLNLSLHCGSEGLCFPSAILPRLPLSSLMARKATSPNVWALSKAELIAMASDLGIVVHSSWTAAEIRAMIQERKPKGSSTPKGLSGMTLAQLQTKARELQVKINPNASKGEIIKTIRDYTRAPDEEVVTFGRYKTYMFREVPEGYLQWAMREVEANTNASEDLRRLAKWAETRGQPTENPDPEVNSTIPYVETDDGYSMTGSLHSWSIADQRPVVPKAYRSPEKTKSRPSSTPSSVRKMGEVEEAVRMEQEVPESVKKELAELNARVAVFSTIYRQVERHRQREDLSTQWDGPGDPL